MKELEQILTILKTTTEITKKLALISLGILIIYYIILYFSND